MPGATIPRPRDPARATWLRRAIGALVGLACHVATPAAVTARPQTLRIPTPFVEDGATVSLEVVIFAPFGEGPFPTPWLYAENDPFYALRHSRANFDAFTSAGGTGTFLAYRLPAGENGHLLIRHPDEWRRDVESFIERID